MKKIAIKQPFLPEYVSSSRGIESLESSREINTCCYAQPSRQDCQTGCLPLGNAKHLLIYRPCAFLNIFRCDLISFNADKTRGMLEITAVRPFWFIINVKTLRPLMWIPDVGMRFVINYRPATLRSLFIFPNLTEETITVFLRNKDIRMLKIICTCKIFIYWECIILTERLNCRI